MYTSGTTTAGAALFATRTLIRSHQPTMASINPRDTQSLWRHAPLQYFLWGRGFSKFASQILTVAVGWQVYDLTRSAFALGMVGLVQFLPTATLDFVAGHTSDRYDRKRVIQLCQVVEAAAAVFLARG